MMAKKILVPLTRLGQIDEVVSYLSDVVKPRTGVIFLIRYPLESGPYWRDHWIEADTARGAKSACKGLMERTSWEAHRALAEEKLSPARKALEHQGVEVEVKLYAGSTKRAVRDYQISGDLDWIVTTAHFSDWVAYLLAKSTGPFDRLKRVKSSFIWLVRPKWI
jgi:nucleotide-binding universal stress UspA family protein